MLLGKKRNCQFLEIRLLWIPCFRNLKDNLGLQKKKGLGAYVQMCLSDYLYKPYS